MATNDNNQQKGEMTTRAAGQKGGQRVKQLIEEGKEMEQKSGGRARPELFGEHAGKRDSGKSKDASG